MPVRKPARIVHTDLALLQREINQLVGRLAEIEPSSEQGMGEWRPPVDVYECRGKITIVLEAPGLSADSLRVACRDGKLVIAGERRDQRPAGVAGFLCMERAQGRFTRVLDLQMALDLTAAEARLNSGLLIITIPRLRDRRGGETVIPVQAEES
jgi:HSP20 family protein